jgi:hypothetical protein
MGFRDFDPFDDMMRVQKRFWRSMRRMGEPLGHPAIHEM